MIGDDGRGALRGTITSVSVTSTGTVVKIGEAVSSSKTEMVFLESLEMLP